MPGLPVDNHQQVACERSTKRCQAFHPACRRLNKLGTFSLEQLGQKKSPFADFMRSARKNNDNFEESLLKLVRTLPTVLKYLPSEKVGDGAANCALPLHYTLAGAKHGGLVRSVCLNSNL